MSMKLFKSVGLVLGMMGALVIAGIISCIMIWIILSGLFLISRFSDGVKIFSEWSRLQFLVTIVRALGIPYVWLLHSAGFQGRHLTNRLRVGGAKKMRCASTQTIVCTERSSADEPRQLIFNDIAN